MSPFFFIQLRLRANRFLILWMLANFLGGYLVSFLENNGLQFAATIFLTSFIMGGCNGLSFSKWVAGCAGGPWPALQDGR